jgi:hypothetical protein
MSVEPLANLGEMFSGLTLPVETVAAMAEQLESELFAQWRSECEMIDKEMARIASARLFGSVDQRQVRKFQFASLVERRNEAARRLLSSRGVIRRVRPSD